MERMCETGTRLRKEGMDMGKFVILGSPSGVMFHLKARNGEVIGASQVYDSRKAAMIGIERVIINCEEAGIEDQTAHRWHSLKCPKFEVYQEGAAYHYRLKAENGDIILNSQGYTAKASCMNGIKSVVDNAPEAEVDG